MVIIRLDPCYILLKYKKDHGKVRRKRWENISGMYTNKKKANVVFTMVHTQKKKEKLSFVRERDQQRNHYFQVM